MLKTEYNSEMDIDAALKLAVKVLSKTMDTTTPSSEKMEFFTLRRFFFILFFEVLFQLDRAYPPPPLHITAASTCAPASDGSTELRVALFTIF